MGTILALVFLTEVIILGYLVYEINVYAMNLAKMSDTVQTFIINKQQEVNTTIADAKAYIANLEKKIDNKFGDLLD
jgi:hypothetical protein